MIAEPLNLKYEESTDTYVIKVNNFDKNATVRNKTIRIADDDSLSEEYNIKPSELVLQDSKNREMIAAKFSYHTAGGLPDYEKQLFSDTNFAGNEHYELMINKHLGYDQKIMAKQLLERISPFSKDPTLIYQEELKLLRYSKGGRNNFVIKVFLVVIFALLVTACIQIGLILSPLKEALTSDIGLFVAIALGVCMVILHCMFTLIRFLHKFPTIAIIFTLMVLLMSFLCGIVISLTAVNVLFYAFVITAGVFVICLGIACTNFDFTRLLFLVVIVIIALITTGAGFIFIQNVMGDLLGRMATISLFLIVIFLSFMMTIELQIILGGKGIQLCTDEYIYGGYRLYSCVLDIFFKLLRLVNDLSGEDDE